VCKLVKYFSSGNTDRENYDQHDRWCGDLFFAMKIFPAIILCGLLLFISSCAPKPPVAREPIAAGVEDELFIKAEKLMEAKDYQRALVAYADYLNQFPDRPFAPAALMKSGKINSILENYEEARRIFQRLITEYPRSSFYPDARLGMLLTYYEEGNYQAVIEQAPDVLDSIDSPPYLFSVYVLVGDSYVAIGAPYDAVRYYVEAQHLATELQQEAISLKLQESIAHLDSPEIVTLLESMDERLPLGDLMFQLGLNYALEEKFDDALIALEVFLERFSEHENAALAESLIKQIRENALFSRYTIGCLLPLSGPYQAVGMRALKGIELALERFSSQGAKTPMNIIIKDTGAKPDLTRLAMQELIEEQVAAIIGPIVTVEVAAQKAQEERIPIITLTQKDNITSIGDFVFRNFITPKMQVKAIAEYAITSLGLSRFAILYPDENYGETFMNLFWDQVIEHGGKVVGLESYNPEHTDFADPIKKLVGLYYEVPEDLKETTELILKEKDDFPTQENDHNQMLPEGLGDKDEEEEPTAIVDFDAIFIPDAPKTAGLIVPQLAFYDVKDIYLLGTNLWHSSSLIKMAEKYVQGAIMPDGFFANSSSSTVRDFVTTFDETYQDQPGFIEAVVYDSAMIVFRVLSQPHLRFKSELKNELLNLRDFPGVTGLTSFDKDGDAQKKLHLLSIKGRKFVELEHY
jgi:branched-chain amino acid transport system substrate-binding protein